MHQTNCIIYKSKYVEKTQIANIFVSAKSNFWTFGVEMFMWSILQWQAWTSLALKVLIPLLITKLWNSNTNSRIPGFEPSYL